MGSMLPYIAAPWILWDMGLLKDILKLEYTAQLRPVKIGQFQTNPCLKLSFLRYWDPPSHKNWDPKTLGVWKPIFKGPNEQFLLAISQGFPPIFPSWKSMFQYRALSADLALLNRWNALFFHHPRHQAADFACKIWENLQTCLTFKSYSNSSQIWEHSDCLAWCHIVLGPTACASRYWDSWTVNLSNKSSRIMSKLL